MKNKKLFSRRNFVKSGIAAAGLSIIGKPSFCATDCPVDTLKTPGPIPLNDIFADYQQVTKKYAAGLMKVTICDKESWESNMPYQFARDDWFVHFNPICRDYIRAGMIPCDIHEIMALCAPRPLFNYSGKKDAIYFPSHANPDNDFTEWWQTVDMALDQVSRIYEIFGKADYFVRIDGEGGHDFPPDVRENAYCWLDKWLEME